ncbi:hypothetical protein OIB37_07850 [Streptomyces sp. NBC_00820]|uniref:hypothetical protein n=1 Tax=Streptomyces sp. NBC_00820 TaxID=2975842 RepID=UPI002ED1B5A6|nr:hypothetical protein OIB37_07850 [Streptomyces sp. NBC_00820]
MSTEARRAPVPPRPTTPPGPTAPHPATPSGPTAPHPATPPGSASGTGREPGAPSAPGHGTEAGPAAHGSDPGPRRTPPGAAVPAADDHLEDEPSVFTPRAPRGEPGLPASESAGTERPGGAAPTDPVGRASHAPSSAVPAAPADPVGPPPPPASARFPDAPPNAGRAARADAGGTRTAVPSRPAPGSVTQPRRPAAPGESRPAQPRRAGVPEESPSETTTRLRPIPAAPGPRADGPSSPPRRPGVPAESASETTTRLRPIPPAPGAPSASTAGGPAPAPARPAFPAPGRPAAGTARSMPAPRPGAQETPTAWQPGHAAGPTAPTGPTGLTGAPGPTGRTGPVADSGPSPDPAHSWTAVSTERPVASFGVPEAYGERARVWPVAVWVRSRTGAAAACLVLGLGLIGGAVTGSWLTGDGGEGVAASGFGAAGPMWHNVPVDQLFPPTVQGTGAGRGGADRTWTRIAVAPDSGCADAFDPLLREALAPVGCRRLLRATYTDATQTYVTTVGLLFTKADATASAALAARFRDEHLDRRADLMPRPYAAKGTAAAGFGDEQRAAWTVRVLVDAPVVVYAVSGWADGRTVDTPQPAAEAAGPGATSAPAQAGLGNEAQGLADRFVRRLRKTVSSATEKTP